jgi:histidine ammonia-lyase
MNQASATHHVIDDRRYTLPELEQLVTQRPTLSLRPDVAAAIARGRSFLDRKLLEDLHIYGVNAGFGALCEIRLPDEQRHELQRRLVLSHACGVGDWVDEDLSRYVLLLKILTFRSGHTGISLRTVERLVEFWNSGVIPAIPQRGTVGASGDLAPLAHMSLPLLGLGSVWHKGAVQAAGDIAESYGWEPIRLEPKEGLALINGVQYINAMAVRSLAEITRHVRYADLVSALSAQAFSVSRTFCHELYHTTSLHQERAVVAANLRDLLAGSNHHDLPTANVSKQDPYSFRCIPQVHAAVRQAVTFATTVIEQEVNGVSDNPLFFPDDDEILFGGNLHGQSTAMSMDFLAIAMAELGSISERRTYQLLSGTRGLPDFLVGQPGINSGFMVMQYTSAALVNENKVLSTPASVDTIPTCQLQEDSVSMGGTSGYKLERVVANCHTILAIELLFAIQAIDLNANLAPSETATTVRSLFRARVPFLSEDRMMSHDIELSSEFLRTQGPELIRDLR